MPHALMAQHEENPHRHPLLLSARFRCDCAANEVLTVQTVIDLNLPDDVLEWTLRLLVLDVRREVRQHMTRASPDPAEAAALASVNERARAAEHLGV
jgi:hypothetical protein